MARSMTAGDTGTDTRSRSESDRHPSEWLALAVGLAFVGAGVIGFFITGFDEFVGRDTDKTLLGLEINPLHNIVHLVIGLAGLAMWRTRSTARTYGWLLAIGYGATFVYGLFAVNERDINILSLNDPDNWFHLASALVGLVIALWPDRDRATAARR